MAYPITRSMRLISLVGLIAGGVALDLEPEKQAQGEFGVRAVKLSLKVKTKSFFDLKSLFGPLMLKKQEAQKIEEGHWEADAEAANAFAEKQKVEAERAAAAEKVAAAEKAAAAERVAAADRAASAERVAARVSHGEGTYDEMYQDSKEFVLKRANDLNVNLVDYELEDSIKGTFYRVIIRLLEKKQFDIAYRSTAGNYLIQLEKLVSISNDAFKLLASIVLDFTPEERKDVIESCRSEFTRPDFF